jgi:ABC-2 type transport system ATP-binding protein
MMYEQGVRRTNKVAVKTEGLAKRYGEGERAVDALAGVDLEIPAGSVLGLLGHNGAGKTTMLRILTTLTAPTRGRAWVAGHDVVAEAQQVRERIGMAGQQATVDDLLSARLNLELLARLYHLPRRAARDRAALLLERVGLADVADRLVKTFSGGMRRRLDLAASLVADPQVLFLDEPTTGLDPHARNEVWGLLRDHVRGGATLVLTTQYLDEADRLADSIVVLDRGAVVARGTPTELKERYGGDRIAVTIAREADATLARGVLSVFAVNSAIDVDGCELIAAVRSATRLVDVVRALDAEAIDVLDVRRRDPTLDDVFLALTSAGRKEAA